MRRIRLRKHSRPTSGRKGRTRCFAIESQVANAAENYTALAYPTSLAKRERDLGLLSGTTS
jgi:hypothetical protein